MKAEGGIIVPLWTDEDTEGQSGSWKVAGQEAHADLAVGRSLSISERRSIPS